MTIIAIDVDDVISPCGKTFIQHHNKHYGTQLMYDEIVFDGGYDRYWAMVLEKELGISEEEGEERFKRFVAHNDHISGQPILDDTKQHLKALSKRFRLQVVTARDESMKEQTTDWLHTNLPDIFEDIHFIRSANKTRTKAEICTAIGAEYIVDDSVEHCNTAAQAGIKALLFGEYGWNSHHTIHNTVVRVKDWNAVEDYFKT